MKNRSRKLVAINGALLLALVVVSIAQHAGAQPGGGAANGRARGDYTLVSGKYQGGTAGVVYILDASNQDLLAIAWDRTRDRFNIIGHRSLADDARVQKQSR